MEHVDNINVLLKLDADAKLTHIWFGHLLAILDKLLPCVRRSTQSSLFEKLFVIPQ